MVVPKHLTNSARRIKALIEQFTGMLWISFDVFVIEGETDHYSHLPSFVHCTCFLIHVQLPTLEQYHSHISSSPHARTFAHLKVEGQAISRDLLVSARAFSHLYPYVIHLRKARGSISYFN